MKKKTRSAAATKDSLQGSSQPRFHTLLYALAAAVAVAGLADAIYLTVSHLAGENVACGGAAQCSEVLSSKYAAIAGIPVAALGAFGYFVAFSLSTLAAFGYKKVRPSLAIAVMAMFLGTLWFLYVQAFVLHSYCTYCLLSAACTFVLAGILLAIPPRH